jgi:hypothetical protein
MTPAWPHLAPKGTVPIWMSFGRNIFHGSSSAGPKPRGAVATPPDGRMPLIALPSIIAWI